MPKYSKLNLDAPLDDLTALPTYRFGLTLDIVESAYQQQFTICPLCGHAMQYHETRNMWCCGCNWTEKAYRMGVRTR